MRTLLKTIAVIGWILPALAWAQAAEPAEPSLPPADATEPTDFPAPGQLPAADPAPAASPATSGGEGEPAGGYSGGDMVIDDGGEAYSDKPSYGGPIPEDHQVSRGDTLWGICTKYYGNGWYWPKLWAHNKTVSNPHWIYPGDRIRLIGGQPGVKQQRLAARQPGMIRMSGQRRLGGATSLQQTIFADPRDLERSGHIAGSKHEPRMLAPPDEVYVRGSDNFQPVVGQAYTVYKVLRPLKSGDRELGHVVRVYGTVRVKRINKHKVATAQVEAVFAPIERRMRVGPLRQTYKELPVRSSTRDLEAKLIDSFFQRKLIGQHHLVFVDRGRKQGVQLGNRFLVLRRGDGWRRNLVDEQTDDPEFPDEIVGEIAVLDLRDDVSIGLVTRTTRALRVGDRLQMRRGY